ncbi:hypothetical protein AGDE_15851 [Angomonas deanei]|uniref:Kinesin motor domain containing protein n=1 Tax=Angomonas deanei TaxID=59799 RepID=A0A7G2C9G7_9TRYP|nr:hypothetical protein AGDE_15851 [Angomonas deanei]CAD2216209.1 hypothetical protein, conserved [Angomonas deanei]|eukprot:EPY18268.1 hypothetical protein AGDE_15851 [Angomonas deanei]
MESYCVIDHSVRADPFFHGVFEDGLRVMYEERFFSFPFTHIFSTAHDLFSAVSAPLIDSIARGQPALLIVASPAVPSHVEAVSPSEEISFTEGEKCSGIAVELMMDILPRLFDGADDCSEAFVSVVTVSAQDRLLVDELGHRRVARVTDVHRECIERENSASQWGPVVKCIVDRQDQLTHVPDSLASETALIITVELVGYEKMVLVDVSSNQDLLQYITLIVGMHNVCGPKSYPPHNPLSALLKDCVLPSSTIRAVCIPNPVTAAKHSLRLLRFGSHLEELRRGVVAQRVNPTTPNNNNRVREPPLVRSTSSSRLEETPVNQIERVVLVKKERDRGETYLASQVVALEQQLREAKENLAKANEQLRASETANAAISTEKLEREKLVTKLKFQIETLTREVSAKTEKVNKLLKAKVSLEDKLKKLSEKVVEQSQLAEKAKTTELEKQVRSLRQALAAERKKAQEIPHLTESSLLEALKQIKPLEAPVASVESAPTQQRRAKSRIISSHNRTEEVVDRSEGRREEETSAAQIELLRQQMTQLQGEVERWRRVAQSAPSGDVPQYAVPASERESLFPISTNDSRQRNSVSDCPNCERLRSQLTLYATQLGEAEAEVAKLTARLKKATETEQIPPPTTTTVIPPREQTHIVLADIKGDEGTRPGVFNILDVVRAVLGGCVSVEEQLNAAKVFVERNNGNVDGITLPLITEHVHAVRSLADAVRTIGAKENKMCIPGEKLPSVVTAADATTVSALLNHEESRIAHLNAFIPTFSQLAIAAEHITMRLKAKGA